MLTINCKISNCKTKALCKEMCKIHYNREYRKTHRQELTAYQTQYRQTESGKKSLKLYNMTKGKEAAYRFNHSEYGRRIKTYYQNYRDHLKSKATHTWLTDKDKQAIKQFYLDCPKTCHVDHIIPINNKDVCGLHVPWNLQILDAKENIKKKNKILLMDNEINSKG